MSEESTPGIWQNKWQMFVLAHVTFCQWTEDGFATCAREDADRLIIHLIGGLKIELVWTDVIGFEAVRAERLRQGDSFVQALNMYWETRSREAQLK